MSTTARRRLGRAIRKTRRRVAHHLSNNNPMAAASERISFAYKHSWGPASRTLIDGITLGLGLNDAPKPTEPRSPIIHNGRKPR